MDDGSINTQSTGSAQVIMDALWLRNEVRSFESKWVEQPSMQTALPGFTWEQLERQLNDLAGAEKADFIAAMVSATRKLARWKPPEMVLREILCLASTVLDDGFQPRLGESETT